MSFYPLISISCISLFGEIWHLILRMTWHHLCHNLCLLLRIMIISIHPSFYLHVCEKILWLPTANKNVPCSMPVSHLNHQGISHQHVVFTFTAYFSLCYRWSWDVAFMDHWQGSFLIKLIVIVLINAALWVLTNRNLICSKGLGYCLR